MLGVFLIGAGARRMVVDVARTAHPGRNRHGHSRQAGTQAAVLNATGYVTARRRATVSSKITGKVIQVNIEEGMAVREGQILARLDCETQRAAVALAVAQAEAARRNVNESEVRLTEARINLDRISKLVGVGYSTAAEVDAARAAVDSLDARIQAAARAGAGGRTPGRAGTPTWTARSSAPRLPASSSQRTRSPAKWSRLSPQVAGSRGRASARLST